jgi:hypothetical protein
LHHPDADCAAQECFAVWRELGLAFNAVEKPLARHVFLLLNLLAQRRPHDVALLGGAGKVAVRATATT